MFRLHYLIAIGVLALTSSPAKPAVPLSEICYSAAVPAANATPPTNTTMFSCPQSGSMTINEIALRGFKIVALKPISGDGSGTNIRQQLTINRGRKIFRNGF